MSRLRNTSAHGIFRHAAAAYAAIYDAMDEAFVRLLQSPGIIGPAEFADFLAAWQPVFGSALMDTSIAAWLTGGVDVARRVTLPLLPPPEEPLLFLPPEAQFISFPILDEGALSLYRKGLAKPHDFDRMAAKMRRESFTVARVTSTRTLKKLRNSLAEAAAQGLTKWEWEHALTDSLRDSFLGPAHAETVYRTNVMRSYSEGMSAVLAKPGVGELFPYEAISVVPDDRLCPLCKKIARGGIGGGRVYRRDDPVLAKIVPPSHWSCLLPDTLVEGRFTKGLKAWYAGKVVEITTRRGNRLTVTANHPVLAVHGFVTADQLRQGQTLLCHKSRIEHGSHANGVGMSVSFDQSKENRPSCVEQVFGSLVNLGLCTTWRAPTTTNDLHGDARFGNGYVDVVGAFGELLLNTDSDRSHGLSDLALAPMNGDAPCCPCLCGSFSLARGAFAPTARFPGGRALAPDCSLLANHARPFQFLSFGLASQMEASRYKAATDYTPPDTAFFAQRQNGGSAQVLLNQRRNVSRVGNLNSLKRRFQLQGFSHRPEVNSGSSENSMQAKIADSDFLRELAERFASVVTRDQIVQIRQYDWSGHVYDLESPLGWYSASGVIVSNCRCSRIPLTIEQAAAEGVGEAKRWLKWGHPPSKPAWVPMPVELPKGWVPVMT